MGDRALRTSPGVLKNWPGRWPNTTSHVLCKELKVRSSKAPKVMVFKDGNIKDQELIILNKYCQLNMCFYCVKEERQKNKTSGSGQG